MKFNQTGLKDAYVVALEPFADERGYFARAFCEIEFTEIGANYRFLQANMSGCTHAGTLRGLHYQDDTAPEAKLFRCIRGAVYDCIVDMRPDSPTYLKWFGIELTADNRLAIFVPPLFAHGYLSLSDGAEVFYQVSHAYAPGSERGVRYDDPTIGITWPRAIEHLSDKDRNWPDVTT